MSVSSVTPDSNLIIGAFAMAPTALGGGCTVVDVVHLDRVDEVTGHDDDDNLLLDLAEEANGDGAPSQERAQLPETALYFVTPDGPRTIARLQRPFSLCIALYGRDVTPERVRKFSESLWFSYAMSPHPLGLQARLTKLRSFKEEEEEGMPVPGVRSDSSRLRALNVLINTLEDAIAAKDRVFERRRRVYTPRPHSSRAFNAADFDADINGDDEDSAAAESPVPLNFISYVSDTGLDSAMPGDDQMPYVGAEPIGHQTTLIRDQVGGPKLWHPHIFYFPNFHAARFVAHRVASRGVTAPLGGKSPTAAVLMAGPTPNHRLFVWPERAGFDALLLAQLPIWASGNFAMARSRPVRTVRETVVAPIDGIVLRSMPDSACRQRAEAILRHTVTPMVWKETVEPYLNSVIGEAIVRNCMDLFSQYDFLHGAFVSRAQLENIRAGMRKYDVSTANRKTPVKRKAKDDVVVIEDDSGDGATKRRRLDTFGLGTSLRQKPIDSFFKKTNK